MILSTEQKRGLVGVSGELSVASQCDLLGIPRSTFYHVPKGESDRNLMLMLEIDKLFTAHPSFGSRSITSTLNRCGFAVNRKRIQRLMRMMGLESVAPKPSLSRPESKHRVFPYLLKGMEIARNNQVWSTDITYIPMNKGFMYLCAVIDWHSRHVLSWELSNTLDSWFCVNALEKALRNGKPEIFNTDQGAQFTSREFTGRLLEAGIQVSMDGKGRALDNVFIERFWRSLKYECIYINRYECVPSLCKGLEDYWYFYSYERPHQALNNQTPAEIYYGGI